MRLRPGQRGADGQARDRPRSIRSQRGAGCLLRLARRIERRSWQLARPRRPPTRPIAARAARRHAAAVSGLARRHRGCTAPVTELLTSTALMLGTALFFVILFRRLGLGATLAYIVSGAVIGPKLLGGVAETE